MGAERRIHQLGLTPPSSAVLPAVLAIPFAWVRRHNYRFEKQGMSRRASRSAP
jgi:hypothetical protein